MLGIWIEQTEGAKFWLRVMTELRNRGLQDILSAVVDGLTGFPDAIASVFPRTVVQTCIVHLIRYAMQFASWKERRPVATALQPIYQAESAAAARGSGWKILTAARGGRNIRPSPRAGGVIGSR
jgi:putative transposase